MWKTTEHYFQAQKFIGTPYVELVRNMNRPREAFEFSREPLIAKWRRSDWDQVKQDVMYKALLTKFSQSPYLRAMLAETGDKVLVERSPYDRYWGDGGDGGGKNHLGKLLMKVRRLISVANAKLCKHDVKSGLDEDQDVLEFAEVLCDLTKETPELQLSESCVSVGEYLDSSCKH